MHKRGLAHLSLTPSHILLASDLTTFKLANLGHALPPSLPLVLPPSFSTSRYTAPEIVRLVEDGEQGPSSSSPPSLPPSLLLAADVYSLGATLEQVSQAREREGGKERGLARQVQALLGRMMAPNPKERPVAGIVLLTAIVLLAKGGREEGREGRMQEEDKDEEREVEGRQRMMVVTRSSVGLGAKSRGGGSGGSRYRGEGEGGGEGGGREEGVKKEKKKSGNAPGARATEGGREGCQQQRRRRWRREQQQQQQQLAYRQCLLEYDDLLRPLVAQQQQQQQQRVKR